MYVGVYVKYRFSCQILMKLGFSGQLIEKYSNFMTVRMVGAELLHAKIRQTDRQA